MYLAVIEIKGKKSTPLTRRKKKNVGWKKHCICKLLKPFSLVINWFSVMLAAAKAHGDSVALLLLNYLIDAQCAAESTDVLAETYMLLVLHARGPFVVGKRGSFVKDCVLSAGKVAGPEADEIMKD